MHSMKKGVLFVLFVVSLAAYSVHGTRTVPQITNRELEQLELINKPAVKSFKTKNGEIVDCVEIRKQLAFDHPLLKNHSIQMKPTFDVSKSRLKEHLSAYSQFLPDNLKCPEGTVLIKRVQKEDLLMAKSSLGKTFMRPNSYISEADQPHDDVDEGHYVASLIMPVKNIGVQGDIDVWGPEAGANQFSSGSIFVASDDGPVANGVTVGWSVNSDKTQLAAFWTRDSGKTTGCFNLLCPGFVQISQQITLGLVLFPLSVYEGPQFEIQPSISQDPSTGNWWLYYMDQKVGYYPKELFTTMGTNGADRAGWGGEVASPATMATPAMGSGHFSEEGFNKSCYIKRMKYFNPSCMVAFPDKSQLQATISNPNCYKALYFGEGIPSIEHFMFFGGPPNCKN